MYRPPVIILGMHRSGTTMITKMLENAGLFVGVEKEVNHEALFFWEINNWIFDLHTATAEKPHNLRYTNPATRKVIVESLEYFVQSSRRKKYLGDHAGKIKDIRHTPFPYGWKDPKNTFTIEFWKEIFPSPKIIHIYRNPIDCVSSYIERDLELKNKFEWNWKKRLKRDMLISKNFHENFRLTTIEEGYNLWEEYVSKALSLKNEFDYLEVRYEDFLEHPFEYFKKMTAFAGLEMNEEEIHNEIKKIQADRAFAFLNNKDYYRIYQQIKDKPLMRELGYDKL